MTAQDRYKGEDGGLYGGGQNELPESLDRRGEKGNGEDRAARCRRQPGRRWQDRAGVDQHVKRHSGILQVQAIGRRRRAEIAAGDHR